MVALNGEIGGLVTVVFKLNLNKIRDQYSLGHIFNEIHLNLDFIMHSRI